MANDAHFEFEGVQTARETAALLRELADGFDGSDRLEFGDGEISLGVPEELSVEIEAERKEGDGIELELEFEWTSADETEAGARTEAEAEDVTGESESESASSAAEAVETAAEGETETTVEGETDAVAEGDARGENAVPEIPPVEQEGPVSAGDVTSLAHFQVYRDRGGRWRWRLVHRNGNIIATGGQGYASRQNALKGLRSVTTNAVEAEIGFSDE